MLSDRYAQNERRVVPALASPKRYQNIGIEATNIPQAEPNLLRLSL